MSLGSDHESFWVASHASKRCSCCGNSRGQYRGRFVEYRGGQYIKPISNRLFCVECNQKIGRAPVDWSFVGNGFAY